ncbi:hypothetical protein CRG98_021969 [Punica granatum]|uniref:Uncharacterized protein n=1 Tax=Punica granatum TaxID=22663 RepID=A0A2I0JMZ4_PUNGR|nr:hypothetical protein CRG98_021969 [Punica granatum]
MEQIESDVAVTEHFPPICGSKRHLHLLLVTVATCISCRKSTLCLHHYCHLYLLLVITTTTPSTSSSSSSSHHCSSPHLVELWPKGKEEGARLSESRFYLESIEGRGIMNRRIESRIGKVGAMAAARERTAGSNNLESGATTTEVRKEEHVAGGWGGPGDRDYGIEKRKADSQE